MENSKQNSGLSSVFFTKEGETSADVKQILCEGTWSPMY